MQEHDNPTHGGQHAPDLESMLDTALRQYSAVEPRNGLEDRIVANLRSRNTAVTHRGWWAWGLATACALLLIGIGLTWNWRRTPRKPLAESPHRMEIPSGTGSKQTVARSMAPAQRNKPASLRSGSHKNIKQRQPSAESARAPKRDQFPSPQPLSEQERILASYVAQYPEHAVLLAQAQAEAERLDREEEMRLAGTGANKYPEQTQQ
jgi:hypothetical protein